MKIMFAGLVAIFVAGFAVPAVAQDAAQVARAVAPLTAAQYRDNDGRRGGDTISCGSPGYKLARCSVPWRDAVLVRQTSDSACVRGRTWGPASGGVLGASTAAVASGSTRAAAACSPKRGAAVGGTMETAVTGARVRVGTPRFACAVQVRVTTTTCVRLIRVVAARSVSSVRFPIPGASKAVRGVSTAPASGSMAVARRFSASTAAGAEPAHS